MIWQIKTNIIKLIFNFGNLTKKEKERKGDTTVYPNSQLDSIGFFVFAQYSVFSLAFKISYMIDWLSCCYYYYHFFSWISWFLDKLLVFNLFVSFVILYNEIVNGVSQELEFERCFFYSEMCLESGELSSLKGKESRNFFNSTERYMMVGSHHKRILYFFYVTIDSGNTWAYN